MFDFKAELQKISVKELDPKFIEHEKDISITFESLNTVMTKLLKKQSAMSMQVEEMYSIIEDAEGNEDQDTLKDLENENNALINALITAADLVEDFYIYSNDNSNEAMASGSDLMWNTLCKAMTAAGLTRISDENTPFDAKLNTIEGVTSDPSLPEGFIVKVLSSGYQYHGKIYRKSTVIVNKLN